jgi:hypothetical protein
VPPRCRLVLVGRERERDRAKRERGRVEKNLEGEAEAGYIFASLDSDVKPEKGSFCFLCP